MSVNVEDEVMLCAGSRGEWNPYGKNNANIIRELELQHEDKTLALSKPSRKTENGVKIAKEGNQIRLGLRLKNQGHRFGASGS